MENRVTQFETPVYGSERTEGEPQRIGTVLAELLAQYQRRFPEARIVLVETPVAAV